MSARLEDFVTVRRVDPETVPEPELVRLVTERPLRFPRVWDAGAIVSTPERELPGLADIGLRTGSPTYFVGGEPNPERGQHDEAFFRRVVVGEPSSVPDLCLAWNLRAARDRMDPFPLWFAPPWLGDGAIVGRIRWAAALAPDRELPAGTPRLHFVSASLDAEILRTLVHPSLADAQVHGPESLDRFFQPASGVGLTAHAETAFGDGVGEVAVPDFTLLGDFMPLERVAWSLSIGGYDPPVGSTRGLPLRGVSHRQARDGLADFVETLTTDPGDLVAVGTHSGIEFVRAFAAPYGYGAAISDKGQQAIAVANLFGEDGLSALASSQLYRLLEDMAQIASRRAVQDALGRAFGAAALPQQIEAVARALDEGGLREGQFERQHRSFGGIRTALGVTNRTCKALVE
jgi:hypothetical protein